MCPVGLTHLHVAVSWPGTPFSTSQTHKGREDQWVWGGSQVQGSNLPSSYVTLSKSPYLSEPPFHQGHNEDRDSPPGLWQRRTNKAYGSISYRHTHMAQCKRSVPIWVTAELKKDYTPLLKPHLGPSESESLGVGLPR